jgi:hypothetical protein
MGTRATYFFKASDKFQPNVTIYIHWDGYPEGAATYFFAMLTHPSKGSAAVEFIRANDQAELTLNHAAHGDTEFRYDLDGSGPDAMLTARSVDTDWDTDKETTQIIFAGPLREFITANAKLIDGFTPFRNVRSRHHSRPHWLNLTTAKLEMEREHSALALLRIWAKPLNNPGPSSNWDSCAEDLEELLNVFPELATDETAALLAMPRLRSKAAA